MKGGSESHEARKALFQLGIKRGTLTLDEIDRALPPGSLSPAERWLLFYSLRAAGVEILDRGGDLGRRAARAAGRAYARPVRARRAAHGARTDLTRPGGCLGSPPEVATTWPKNARTRPPAAASLR